VLARRENAISDPITDDAGETGPRRAADQEPAVELPLDGR
jgi:hypothetical protein